MAKKCLWLAVLMTLTTSTGCCRWHDRWCGNHHAGSYGQACAPVACQPVCQPVPQCCPAPAAPACVPVGSSPAAGWQRNPCP